PEGGAAAGDLRPRRRADPLGRDPRPLARAPRGGKRGEAAPRPGTPDSLDRSRVGFPERRAVVLCPGHPGRRRGRLVESGLGPEAIAPRRSRPAVQEQRMAEIGAVEDRGKKLRKRALVALAAPAVLYLLLLIPDGSVPPLPPTGSRGAFSWNQDDRWKELESRFDASRRAPQNDLRRSIREESARVKDQIARAREGRRSADDPLWGTLEQDLFLLGSQVASAPSDLPAFADLVFSMRDAVKEQSVHWDVRSPEARIRLYRLLYGGRAALEGAMLQAPSGTVPAVLK